MNGVLTAQGLGRRYGRRWALRDCSLDVPAGHVVGLVGPNGVGKTTLLKLAAGQLSPSEGSIAVLGGNPPDAPGQRARIGFVAQDAPVYAGLSVADHLRLGARLNPAGTPRSPTAASGGWAWTRGTGRAGCPAASAPSSRSPWAWPNGPNCCSWTSRSLRSTRWPAASSSRA